MSWHEHLEVCEHLMCEAMIAEAVLPIAATGRFGNIDGFAFLSMVEAKVDWIISNHQQLCGVLGG